MRGRGSRPASIEEPVATHLLPEALARDAQLMGRALALATCQTQRALDESLLEVLDRGRERAGPLGPALRDRAVAAQLARQVRDVDLLAAGEYQRVLQG